MQKLTFVSLNIASACVGEGMGVVVHSLNALHADVAFLQELSRVSDTFPERQAALEHAGWAVYAAPPAAEGRHPVHTAILVRQSSLRRGLLRVRGPPVSGADGRCLRLLLEWGPQLLAATCVYLPSGGGLPGGPRPADIIATTLHAWACMHPGAAPVWGGDWNCALRAADRASGSLLPYDTAARTAWAEADTAHLADAWLELRPQSAPVEFTSLPQTGMGQPARLDRFYLARALLPRARCTISSLAVERHMAVVLELQGPASGRAGGRRAAARRRAAWRRAAARQAPV